MSESDRTAAVGRVLEQLFETNRILARARVVPFAGLELGRSHLEVLFLIAHRDDVSPGVLASTMRISASAVTQLVAKLREAALVVSTPSPTDSRSILFSLTGSAQDHLAEFEARAVEHALPHFDALTTADVHRLGWLLHSVGERS